MAPLGGILFSGRTSGWVYVLFIFSQSCQVRVSIGDSGLSCCVCV